MVMRKIAFLMLEPPVFAAIVPSSTKKRIDEAYKAYSIPDKGQKSTTISGNIPPSVKAAPEANAAWIGFA